MSALRLAEKGCRVAVLETGRRFAGSDFPKTNWNVRKFCGAPSFMSRNPAADAPARRAGALWSQGRRRESVYANTLPVPQKVFGRPEWPPGLDWERGNALRDRQAHARGDPESTLTADKILKQCAAEIGKADTWHPTEVAVFFGEPGKTVPDRTLAAGSRARRLYAVRRLHGGMPVQRQEHAG